MDQVESSDDIISFEFYEGTYIALHRFWDIWSNDAVVMKYLGDSSKDILMECLISPDYNELYTSRLYHYHIPCYIKDTSKLNEGTYCIEIIKDFYGDIKSENYCNDDFSFQVKKSTNIPILTVVGFSNEQKWMCSTRRKSDFVSKG